MIIFIQFPIIDIRLFIAKGVETVLPKPNWPAPEPRHEFIRGFGKVYQRTKGGINSWVGESHICDAKRAIKFAQVAPFRSFENLSLDLDQSIEFEIKARHFYFDGWSTGKLELVLVTKPSSLEITSPQTVYQIITHILNEITVRTRKFSLSRGVHTEQTDLKNLGKYISNFYYWASTPTNKYSKNLATKVILSCAPVILLEAGHNDNVIAPKKSRKLERNFVQGIEIFQWWQHNLKIWLINYNKTVNGYQEKKSLGRALRIYLMRLHTESEGLRRVLLKIKDGSIPLIKNTEEFDFLQSYLNDTTKRILIKNKKLNKKYKLGEIEEIAKETIEKLSPGEINGLLRNIKLTRIRPQVYKKTEHFARDYFSCKPSANHIVIQGDIKGDGSAKQVMMHCSGG